MHNNISVTCVFHAFLSREQKFKKRPPPDYVIWPLGGWPRIYFGDKMYLLALIKRITQVGNWIISRKSYPDDEKPVTKHSFLIWLHPVKTISIAFVWNKKMRLAHSTTDMGRLMEGVRLDPSTVSWAGSVTWFPYPQLPADTSTLTRRFFDFYHFIQLPESACRLLSEW